MSDYSASRCIWPQGCRIVFNIPNPATGGVMVEDVLDARNYVLTAPLLELYNAKTQVVRVLNFSTILIITGLETVGPAGAASNA